MANRDRATRSSELLLETPAHSSKDPDVQIAAAIDVLVNAGALSQEKLSRARAINQKTHERLDFLLVKLGLVNEDSLAQALAEACGLPLIRRDAVPTTPAFTDILSTDYLRAQRVAPIQMADGSVQLVIADPFNTDAQTAVGF